MDSLLLTLTISGLTLHSGLFIETHSNGFTLDRVPKNIIVEISICLINLNIFVYTIIQFHFFPLNICECLTYHEPEYNYNQH